MVKTNTIPFPKLRCLLHDLQLASQLHRYLVADRVVFFVSIWVVGMTEKRRKQAGGEGGMGPNFLQAEVRTAELPEGE